MTDVPLYPQEGPLWKGKPVVGANSPMRKQEWGTAYDGGVDVFDSKGKPLVCLTREGILKAFALIMERSR